MQFWNLKKKYKRRDRIEKLSDVHTEISVNIRELFCCEQVMFAGDIYLSRLVRTSSRTSSTESVTSSA